MNATAPAGASVVMAVELLDTQYTRRPVAAFTNPGKDCTFWARTESVMSVKPTVEVQNCTYWYLPPFVALFQPAAKSQPRGLYAQHGLLEQVPVPGMGQEGAAQQADDELAIAAPDVTEVPAAMLQPAISGCAAPRAHNAARSGRMRSKNMPASVGAREPN